MRMGQQSIPTQPKDPRAVARGEAQARLAQALSDLQKADEILASIESIVAAREAAHRTSAAWMATMATEARNAVATRSLDRLMTPDWLRRLSAVGQRHDTATQRLLEALEERAKAVAAHQKIAYRVKQLQAEVERLGPSAYVPTPPVRAPYPYYPTMVSPYYAIAQWAR